MKYAFKAGAEVIVPPGDFVNFSYAVENIGKVLEAPLSGEEMRLLEREYPKVKDEPFFESA